MSRDAARYGNGCKELYDNGRSGQRRHGIETGFHPQNPTAPV
ncbi:hypothetical protein RBSWK_03235 [Rhodopirellula baltica SWK14]|uniref:Uncharacterized protein n=1 Tax=Rhodopirellula baltica SWK14 TaxID=993516 RepID=L7CFH0_RHOBT|nr:hypothetical protein RBSWK_03235 [Rhodopirellula baltica SWK14]